MGDKKAEKGASKKGRLSVNEIVEALGLLPHPEGGYFRETYRSSDILPEDGLPGRYEGPRNACTCIYYLITAGSFSAMHRLNTDEILHFYAGDPARIFMILPDGEGREIQLGANPAGGEAPQVIVPRGAWFGVRVAEGGDYTLMGSTVSPGFDFKDFELGEGKKLIEEFPRHSGLIDFFR